MQYFFCFLITSFLSFILILCASKFFKFNIHNRRRTIPEFDENNLIGKIGIAYQKIPVQGTGYILLSLPKQRLELEAIAEDAEEIHSFSRVEVIRVLTDKKVSVRKVCEEIPGD